MNLDLFTPDPEPLFGAEDVVFAYTDQDALDDGVLVEISRTDRVTRTLWERLIRWSAKNPADRWPVELLGACAKEPDRRAKAWAVGLTTGEPWRRRALADEYVRFWYDQERHALTEVAPLNPHAVEMWLRLNELGGVTLMLPEDN